MTIDRAAGRSAKPDQLVRNSFFLSAATGTMALLGFGFWFVVARLYPPEQVGPATSLISAVALIAYVSLFGLNGTVVRFLAGSARPNAMVTQSLCAVAVLACAISAGYLLLVSGYAPELAFVTENPWYAVGFVAAGILSATNLLTDSVFVAARRPEFNLLIDGVVQGITKLLLPAGLVALGAYGIFAASGVGALVATLTSLVCLHRVLGYRAEPGGGPAIGGGQVRYSFAGWIASVLNVMPIMVLPLIVLHVLGDAAAGYYYIAFQIANVLYAVSQAVGDALVSEGSFDESALPRLLRRSGLLLVAVQVPAIALVVATSRFSLSLFGGQYAAHGRDLLVVFAVGSVAVSLHLWASSLLRLTGQMTALVLAHAVYVVVTIGWALAGAERGLAWFGWAWLIGNAASAVVAVGALLLGARRAGTVRGPA